MAVSRAEGEAFRVERHGETEEAAKIREQVKAMRYEDPYTALQDELDEAVKNEVRTGVYNINDFTGTNRSFVSAYSSRCISGTITAESTSMFLEFLRLLCWTLLSMISR